MDNLQIFKTLSFNLGFNSSISFMYVPEYTEKILGEYTSN